MKEKLISKIEAFKGKRILVWGDIILDEYIYTTSNRVSREAPVLITEFEEESYLLGGAGNVLLNIKQLGGIPNKRSFVG